MRHRTSRKIRLVIVVATLSLRAARDRLYRTLIRAALRQAHQNQVLAAQLLGISRFSLIRWRRKLHLAA